MARPTVRMRVIGFSSSTIGCKSCEVSSLQSARGCAANRAQPGADPRAAARLSREGRLASLAGRRAPVRDPRADDVGADRDRRAADLDPAGLRAGVHRLQLHRAAARGRASHDLRAPASGRGARARLALRRAERHLREPVHPLAPGSPRRARVRRRRSQAAPPVAEDQRALVQAAVLFAGAVPDLFPRGAEGKRDLSGRAAAAHRPRAQGVDRARTSRCSPRSGRSPAAWPPRAPTSSRCSSSSRSRSP